MPRAENKKTPVITSGIIYTNDDFSGSRVGTDKWFEWVATGTTFSLSGVTFAAQKRYRGYSWYAYKRRGGKLHKVYVGRCPALTLARLLDVVAIISG